MIPRLKRQLIERPKIISSHISDKGLITRIRKEGARKSINQKKSMTPNIVCTYE
jgi:hypothetical protein